MRSRSTIRLLPNTELARRLTEAAGHIFAEKPDGSLEIVEQNLDECVLCRLCLDFGRL